MIKFITLITILLQFCTEGRVADVQLYARSGEVCCINYTTDIVFVEDSAGNAWGFHEAEDWRAGDHIAMVMCDMGTEDITDDMVLSARYEG